MLSCHSTLSASVVVSFGLAKCQRRGKATAWLSSPSRAAKTRGRKLNAQPVGLNRM
ncbi:hypothetical protein HY251_09405 [bacterium]|nr:hypothetical protein [bacterium]